MLEVYVLPFVLSVLAALTAAMIQTKLADDK